MLAKWRCGYLPALAALMLAALGGCGDSGNSNMAGGGIGGTGISVGVISARERPATTTATAAVADGGSITVNGIKFALDSTTAIMKDDVPATLNEIHTGMVAEVYGVVENNFGHADRVVVDDAIRAVVESDPVDNMFTAAGQTILVDDTTVFNPFNPLSPKMISQIHPGDLIDIYGLVKGPGVVKAMYFERRMPPSGTKVRGLVENLTATTFTVGALTVNYAMAQSVPAELRNNLFVEVRGTCSTTPVCGTLNAAEIEADKLDVQDAEWARVEGFVTTVTPTALLTVGNQAVIADASTQFAGGLPSDIAPGVRVEAEGSLVGGVVRATKIVFEDGIQFEANVETVGSGTLTLAGLPGIAVDVNSQTDFKGGAVPDLSKVLGANVRVRGRLLDPVSADTVVATELELRSVVPDTDVVLQAPVQVIAPGSSVTILGITVNTVGLEFEDVNDQPIDSTAFFNALAVGDLVKVKGDLAAMSSNVTWGEIELEE